MAEIELRSTLEPDDPATVTALRTGEIDVLGRMPWSSNGTFLVRVHAGDDELTAIYKPERGERPLWDFPAGLWRRERAARLLDEALGWRFVPPTEVRHDAPLGVGTVQFFVPSDLNVTAFDLVGDERFDANLARLAAFDVVANNTDRKAGHCLPDGDGRVWAIDHGLCFHAEEKLRTVLWEYAGQPLEGGLRSRLAAFSVTDLDPEFGELLSGEELDAMVGRAQNLALVGVLPSDPSGRRYPWPLV